MVFFHIGGHKTGTTYLQGVLWRNRAALRRAGILYPGSHRAAHVWANLDLRGAGIRSQKSAQVSGAWPRLVDEIRQWNGPAIIDHELFSLTSPRQIARALRDLDFADVQVVFTARDMARQLPAAWQEWLKNRSTITFADFLNGVRKPHSAEEQRFMGMHDVPTILARWAGKASPDRVRLITVPPPGSDRTLLWVRFADVLGIDPDGYDLTAPQANTSLGAVEASVLRQLNEQIGDVLSAPDYDRLVKFGLARALAHRDGPGIALPDEAYEWAVAWAHRTVATLAAAGYPVIGDLAELVPRSRPTGLAPDSVDPEARVGAAIAALGIVVRRQAASDARRTRRRAIQQRTDQPHVAGSARRLVEQAVVLARAGVSRIGPRGRRAP